MPSYALKSNATTATAKLVFVGENGLVDLVTGAAVLVQGTVSATTVGGRVVYGDGNNTTGNHLKKVVSGGIATTDSYAVLAIGHFGINAFDDLYIAGASTNTSYGTAFGGGPRVAAAFGGYGIYNGAAMTGYAHPDTGVIRALIYGRDSPAASLVSYHNSDTDSLNVAGQATNHSIPAGAEWWWAGRKVSPSAFGAGIFAVFVGITPQALKAYIDAGTGTTVSDKAYDALFTVVGPDTTPPTLTGSVTISAITATSATATWSAGADNVAVTSYETSLDGTTWTDRGNVLTYTFTGLTQSTAYTARVRAKDAAGNVSTPPITGAFTTSATAATAILMSGPTGGQVSVASTNFTLSANGAISGSHVVTPSDGGAGGTFAPTTVTLTSAAPTGTFTYTPSSTGARTISAADAGGYTAPATITYTSAPPALAFSGTIPGQNGTASTAYGGLNVSSYWSGGVTPYTYSVFAGALPAGLTLNSSAGTIAGTPTTAGTYNTTIRVTDSAGAPATANSNSFAWTIAQAAATAILMSGPTGGQVSVASADFTLSTNGAISGSHVVTPSDGGAGGTFTPATVTLTAGAPTGTFTYTPSSTGARTISASDAGGYTAPATITYTANATAGTLTSSALKNNTGTVLATLAAEAFVHNATSGALVVKKTGLTSNGSGIISFSDGTVSAATAYRVVWRLTVSGAEGIETLTAT